MVFVKKTAQKGKSASKQKKGPKIFKQVGGKLVEQLPDQPKDVKKGNILSFLKPGDTPPAEFLQPIKPEEVVEPLDQGGPDASLFDKIDEDAKKLGSTVGGAVRTGLDAAKGLFAGQDYLTPDGNINKNYMPKSEEEIEQMSIPDDMKDYFYGKLYQGQDDRIRADEFAVGFDEELDEFLTKQDEQKSELEKQVAFAKETATRQREEAEAAQSAQMAQGREGVISTGNFLADEQMTKVRKGSYDMRISELDREVQRLNDLQLEQQKGVIGARADIVRQQVAEQAARVQAMQESMAAQEKEEQERMMGYLDDLTESGAIANLPDEALQYIADGLPGAPPGFLEAIVNTEREKKFNNDQEVQWKKQQEAVNVFTDIMNSGTELAPELLAQFGMAAGMDEGSLYPFYVRSQEIMADNKMDDAMKQIELAKNTKELENTLRGIQTTDAQNNEYLMQLYRDGAPPEIIDQFKRATGLVGLDDPLIQLDMQIKRAELEYKNSQTSENYAKIQDLKAKRDELDSGTAAGSYYIPKKSLNEISSKFENGKLIINTSRPYQCGEFVNRFWGLSGAGAVGMADTEASKTNQIKARGHFVEDLTNENFQDKIYPGMAFVSKFGGVGHTGIVTAVHADGTFDTMEANIGDTNWRKPDPARPKTRSIRDNDLIGFAAPPDGKADFHKIENAVQFKGIKGKFHQIALDQGLKGEKAIEFAEQRVEDSYKPMTEAQGSSYSAYSKLVPEREHYEELVANLETDDVALENFANEINVLSRKIKEDGLTAELVNKHIDDPNVRKAVMSEMRWINAKLRKESGAAISQSEYETEGTMYFPRAGDDASTLRIKAQRRKAIEDGLFGQMGPAGERLWFEQRENMTDTSVGAGQPEQLETPEFRGAVGLPSFFLDDIELMTPEERQSEDAHYNFI